MYVSSFSTYINTDSSIKAQKSRLENTKSSEVSFQTTLLAKSVKNVNTSAELPINYISNYKALNNQQKLQENTPNASKEKFVKLEAAASAKNAYSDNSKIYSLILAPRVTLDQTPKIDKRFSQNTQAIQESNLRHTMINTYISNESYYKITA